METNNTYELVIIGGGPAGAAGAVYSARKQIKSAIVVSEWGGQSQVSEKIYNWIGTKEISGAQLAKDLKDHALSYVGNFLDSYEGVRVMKIEQDLVTKDFVVTLSNDQKLKTKSVLVTSGSSRRKLEIENAHKYEHKGITYCATCDGPVFAGLDVIVVGGGNAGIESAMQLSAYCKSVTVIHKNQEFKADAISVQKLFEKENVKKIMNAEILKVDGDNFIKSLTYKDKATGVENTLETSGVFVEIGQIPNSDFVKDIVDLNSTGNIVVDAKRQRSSLMGIWAAGDVTDGIYHQNNIAAGDAVKAIEDIYQYIHTNK